MKTVRFVVLSCSVSLAILLSVFLIPHYAQAISTTWYVAPTGNDANDCLTTTTPCATINGALQKPIFVQGDTVLVASGLYTGTSDAVGAITTSVQLLGGWNSDFTVQSGLSTLDGENQRRGLKVMSATVTLDHFIVQHGNTLTSTRGGGLLLQNSIVTVTGSIVRENVASDTGAGIQQTGGVLDVENSALLDNVAGDNASGDGGALYQNGGVANLTNSTVSGNWAGFGGGAFGLYNDAVLNLNNTTVVSNVTPGYGGAITIDYFQGQVNLQNTILAGNQGGPTTPECTGPVHSLGYNLVGSTTGCTFTSGPEDRLNMSPQVGILTGTIPYYDLFSTHPAVNMGNPDGCRDSAGNLLSSDQRGLPRVGRCDIGAIELQPLEFSRKLVNSSKALPGGLLMFTIALADGGNSGFPSVAVTDSLPEALSYVDTSLSATSGSYGYSNGVITWTGSIEPAGSVTITYQTLVSPTAPLGYSLTNSAVISGGGELLTRSVTVDVPLAKVFLPMIIKPQPGIMGYVTVNGIAAAGVPLDLRFFNGSSWSTLASTSTDSAGKYLFTGVPSLGSGQRYYVRFLNPSTTADGRLADWYTRSLLAYTAGESVAIGDFDLADITLQSPPPGATIALPYVFQWTRRLATPADTYEFNLFDPSGTAFFYTIPPLGYVDRYTLNGLPSGFARNKSYGWFIATYSPDGGYGESFYYNPVTFSKAGLLKGRAAGTRKAMQQGDFTHVRQSTPPIVPGR